MQKHIEEKVNSWLNGAYDQKTKEKLQGMLDAGQEDELYDAFYKDLEFGTGGMRGLMGIGTNRMNRYTVGAAAQGLANYLKKTFLYQRIKVAVAYDSRNGSKEFAQTVANVLSGNQAIVYLFEDIRPTPLLSFAIRHLGCHSGIVLTASHNPKEYNGLKAYWDDGAQVVEPHDKNIIDEVKSIMHPEEINFHGEESLIKSMDKEVDEAYFSELKKLCVSKDAVEKHGDIKIVYSPIHGTGIRMVPQALELVGFSAVTVVKEQAEPDGNFPTVTYPNPEEKEAMSMALKKAKEIDADLVLATDPDADRVGIAVKNLKGEFELLNGNQTGALLMNYLLQARKESGTLSDKDYIVKTIVTTYLIDDIAMGYGVKCLNTLTGFKHIASIIREAHEDANFIAGCEESYGYMIGDFVRDKDAVSACVLIAEMCAFAKGKDMTLYEMLVDIFIKHDFYKESLLSLTKKGEEGEKEITAMMERFRKDPPTKMGGIDVTALYDYDAGTHRHLGTGTEKALDFTKSNVMQFVLADGSLISARPSGTEPKIKFYISVREPLASKEEFEKVSKSLDGKIEAIKADLKV